MDGDWNGDDIDETGVFRKGVWILDLNGNRSWDGPDTEPLIFFGYEDDIPVTGDWNGDGVDEMGVFRKGAFILDLNGNRMWDGQLSNECFFFGYKDGIPVAGDWNGDGADEIGVFANGAWILDMNASRTQDDPDIKSRSLFGYEDDMPVTGDWNGDGVDEIGVFRNGVWIFDVNGNRTWDGQLSEGGFLFGDENGVPTTGDWNGDGADEIGMFRDGIWTLDLNGNRMLDDTLAEQGFLSGREEDVLAAGHRSQENADEVSPGPIRLPIHGEREAFQTMQVTGTLTDPRVVFSLEGSGQDALELGLVRTSSKHGGNGEYIVRVYETTGRRRTKLAKETGKFELNQWKLIRVVPDWGEERRAEIFCTVKPKRSLVERARSLFARNEDTFYRDFSFLQPTVLRVREPEELNVIIISFDTLRADHVSSAGYHRPTTPHLDSFAQRGVLFPYTISSAPWTTPATLSLLSGRYFPQEAEKGELATGGVGLQGKLIAEILREHGYYTIGITGGEWVSSPFGFARGFDRYIEYDSLPSVAGGDGNWFNRHEDGTKKVFETALDWLDDHRNSKFFMFLHHYECHSPYEDTFFVDAADTADLLEHRKALYDGDIRRADQFFGKLVEKLEELDLMSKTVIVVASDHGEEFGDHYLEDDRIPPPPSSPPEMPYVSHGHSLYDELLRVFTIFRIPGLQPAKRILDNQVRLIDVVPTILDALEISTEQPLQGHSLLDLMQAGERQHDPPAFSNFTCYGPPQSSVRFEGYKYIYCPDPHAWQSFTFRNIPQHALFDLRKDPGETKNIYEQNRSLAREYHNMLEKNIEETLAINRILAEKASSGETESPSVPEELVESLKAIGYID
ncbi:MAG: hypothetical protein Kow0099_05440 [Candidatus Abyssubacteria bacterium]